MYYGRKAMPVSSKYLAQQEWKENQERLKNRVQNARPGIDNRAPKEFPHLYQNGKKEQLLEDRYAQIENDNRHLLNKMSDILTRKPSHLPQNSSGTAPAWMYAHSLNRDSRRKELKRITEENFRLLKRIQGVHASFDRKKLEKDRARQEKLILNMTEYHKMPIQGPRSTSPAKGDKIDGQGSMLNSSATGSPSGKSKEGSMISFASGSVGGQPPLLMDQGYPQQQQQYSSLANAGSGVMGGFGGGYGMYGATPGTAGSMASYSSGGMGIGMGGGYAMGNNNLMAPGTAGGSYPNTPGGYGIGMSGANFSSNLGASFAAPGTRGQLGSAGSIGSYGGAGVGMGGAPGAGLGMGVGLNPSSGGSYLAGAGRFGIGGGLGGGLGSFGNNSATTPGGNAPSNLFGANRPATFGSA